MKTLQVRVQDKGQSPAREQQLAWHIAALAASRPPVDPDAASMVASRIIDNAAVGIAALRSEAVNAAQAQALAFPRRGGATLLGQSPDLTVDCSWAAWANGTAVRELDLHDNFYGFGVSHPADAIPPLIAVAEQCGKSGSDLIRAILVTYEISVALTSSIDLNAPGVDHVAHLGPAVAAGLGSLLDLDVETIYQAVNQAAHVSCTPLQARKGMISSWKAAAPAHVGKLAIEAVDRAMRGQTSPVPIYEGASGLLATLFRSEGKTCLINLPDGEPHRAILQTYPKAHAAGYHGQALMDLAFRLNSRIPNKDQIKSVRIKTKSYTHNYLGTGAGDPSKMDPFASRETLDHSIMYVFAIALQDGAWHHEQSYLPERAQRPDTVELWHKISTSADPEWTRRFQEPLPIDKDHGGQVEVLMNDGTIIVDELAVPDSHPRGLRPFTRPDYIRKFEDLTSDLIAPIESRRFLAAVESLPELPPGNIGQLNVSAVRPPDLALVPRGIFDVAPIGTDQAVSA